MHNPLLEKVDWSLADYEKINQLASYSGWFLKKEHRDIAARASRAIFNLRNNIQSLETKLKAAEDWIDTNREITNNAKTKIHEQSNLANELKQQVKDLEEVNDSLNLSLVNYDKTLERLEKENNELKASLVVQQDYIDRIRAILPQS